MKKLISLCVCIALALMCAGAMASGTVIYRGEEYSEDMRAAAYLNGVCYLFFYDESIKAVTEAGETVQCAWAEDTFAADEGENYELSSVFADDETLYAIIIRKVWDEEDQISRVKAAYLYTLEIANGVISLGDKVKLDWDEMIESYEDDEFSRSAQSPFITNGVLAFTAYGYNGTQIMAYEVETGDASVFEMPKLYGLTKYKDGLALAMNFDYDYKDGTAKVSFMSVDLSNGDMENIADFPSGSAYPSVFYYDSDADALYYMMSGELWVAAGFDFSRAQSICAAKEEGSIAQPVKTSDGYILFCAYTGVVKYNTDPNARPSKKLTVTSWGSEAEKAEAEFIKSHPDTEIAMTYNMNDIVGAMTSQSSAVDVYRLDIPSSEYSSLFARGFMADLSNSEKLTGLTSEMYDAVKSAVIKDGKLRALPISMYCRVYSCSLSAFKKAGLGKEDVPATWKEFFEILKKLPEAFENNPDLGVFDPSKTVSDIRRLLATDILENYAMYLSDTGTEGSFDSQLLRELFKMLDEVDYEALRIPEKLDTDSFSWSDDVVLFDDYGGISCDRWRMGDDSRALMPLALDESIKPIVPCYMSVMFVNPYSENTQLAIEFLECTADELDPIFLTDATPSRNEPIPDPYADQERKYYEDTLSSLEESYKTAPEEDKITYEEGIKSMREELKTFEESGMYRASAASIADYRSYADMIRVKGGAFGLDISNSSEISALIQQYADRAIDCDALIRGVDQKLRMIMLEGA